MNRTNCFAYKKTSTGHITCSALTRMDCDGCNFFKTKQEYREKVEPLKHTKDKK